MHAQLFDIYAYEYERNKALLEVVHDLFEQQTNLDAILFRIMQKAQTLLKCQRCSVLLIMDKNDQTDNSNSRKAFDLFQSGNRPGQRRHRYASKHVYSSWILFILEFFLLRLVLKKTMVPKYLEI